MGWLFTYFHTILRIRENIGQRGDLFEAGAYMRRGLIFKPQSLEMDGLEINSIISNFLG